MLLEFKWALPLKYLNYRLEALDVRTGTDKNIET